MKKTTMKKAMVAALMVSMMAGVAAPAATVSAAKPAKGTTTEVTTEATTEATKKDKPAKKVKAVGIEKGKKYTVTVNGVKTKKEKNYSSFLNLPVNEHPVKKFTIVYNSKWIWTHWCYNSGVV